MPDTALLALNVTLQPPPAASATICVALVAGVEPLAGEQERAAVCASVVWGAASNASSRQST